VSEITLRSIRHSYLEAPESEEDWALKSLDVAWSDGGAYALLGPSGCGKTTLLNIVSGLIALLLRVYSDQPAQEILGTEPDFIAAIGLDAHLSPTRKNGLHAMISMF